MAEADAASRARGKYATGAKKGGADGPPHLGGGETEAPAAPAPRRLTPAFRPRNGCSSSSSPSSPWSSSSSPIAFSRRTAAGALSRALRSLAPPVPSPPRACPTAASARPSAGLLGSLTDIRFFGRISGTNPWRNSTIISSYLRGGTPKGGVRRVTQRIGERRQQLPPGATYHEFNGSKTQYPSDLRCAHATLSSPDQGQQEFPPGHQTK